MPHLSCAAPRARRAGFSLIELLVTIVLVGLVAMFTIPRFNTIVGEQRVSRAAQATANDMQVAVAIAQRSHKPIRITWESDSLRLVISDRAGTTYRQLRVGGSDGYNISQSQASVYPTSGVIEVFPNALASDSMSLQFTSTSGYSKRVRMTRAGLVQLF